IEVSNTFDSIAPRRLPGAPGRDGGGDIMADDSIKEIVKQKYGLVALRVTSEGGACGSSTSSECDPVTSNLYAADEATALPADAVARPRRRGNPAPLGELRGGQVGRAARPGR